MDIKQWAIARAKEIVLREGAEFALSVADRDPQSIEGDSTVLAAAIAAAIIDAYELGRERVI